MRSLGIRTYGDKVLRGDNEEVETFDDELAGLIEEMVETMILEGGVGLAAPQVGVSRRIAVVNPDPHNPDTLITLVNPRIVSCSEETECVEEGCLSVPGIRAKVDRPIGIEVEYQGKDGAKHCARVDGLVSRIMQHEIDHLDGVLFVDRLSFGRKTMIKGKLRNLARSKDQE